LMGSRAPIENWKSLGFDAQNYRLQAGLISNEEFKKILEEKDIKRFQKSVHYANSLTRLEEEEEDIKNKLFQESKEAKGKLDSQNNQLESENFNMHFYRIMTSLMLFGVIPALDIVASACDLMGGDFSESIKEIFGSEKVMGDLAKFYQTVKLDEVAGGLAQIPVLEQLNQAVVDTLSSEYLAPVTEIGGQMLSSELANLALGAVLIANRGINEYNLYDKANKLSDSEIKQIDELKKHVATTLKNTQKIATDVYKQKKDVALNGIKTDLYWDKVDSDQNFAEEFLKNATKYISDDNLKKTLLNTAPVEANQRTNQLKQYLLQKENHNDLIKIDKFMRDDFSKHTDLNDKFSEKLSNYYQEQMKNQNIENSVQELIDENNEKNRQSKNQPELKKEIDFLQRFFENTDKENFVKTEIKQNSDYATSIFDKVLIHHNKPNIIFDIKSKKPPTATSKPSAMSLGSFVRSSGGERG
ncbi:MAG: hypothetical protein ACKN9I_02215, partial [Alphaproteobacteria bacterium]